MSAVNIALLKHQLDFVSDTSTRYLGLCSGYGGGKTYAFCIKAITLAALNVGYRGALYEPTNVMIRDVLVPMMDQVLDQLGIPYEYKVSPLPSYTLKFGHGTTQILLRSGENFKKTGIGLNLAFFGVDESDTMNKSTATALWRALQSRLRAGKVYQGFTTSTPEGFAWMHDFFVNQAKEDDGTTKADRRLIKARTTDNPFLPTEYIDSLRSNYPANLIEAYLNGEFVNLNSETVYPNYDREINNNDRTANTNPNAILHVGLDFNVGKMAATVAVIHDGIPYFVDELYGAKNTEDFIKKLKAKYPNRQIYIYPDSSGKNASANADRSSIVLLEQSGLKCFYHSKNPAVKDRVRSVNAMMRNGKDEVRCFVNAKTCPQIVNCLEQQSYKDGKPDKESGTDHMNDALGYFLYFRWPLQGKSSLTVYN